MKLLFLALGHAAVAYERTGWPGAKSATRLAGWAFWHGLGCKWGGMRRVLTPKAIESPETVEVYDD